VRSNDASRAPARTDAREHRRPPGAAPELADYAALFPARRILEDFAWAARPTAERPLLTHQPRQLAWIEEHDARRPSLGAGGGLASAEQVSAL
jgi:hypothetical protein